MSRSGASAGRRLFGAGDPPDDSTLITGRLGQPMRPCFFVRPKNPLKRDRKRCGRGLGLGCS